MSLDYGVWDRISVLVLTRPFVDTPSLARLDKTAKFQQRGEDLESSFVECRRLLQEAQRQLGSLEEQVKREEEDEEREAELKKIQAELKKLEKDEKFFLGLLEEHRRDEKKLPWNVDTICSEGFSKEMQRSFDEKNTEMLQYVMNKLNPEEGRYHLQRCIDSGLWVPDLKEEED
ncbi:hsp90 co-chaperone Cdc37 isoform X2 [Poeciliopsis prolifica]|uniref:hsp90 co-chaperone Cdc37 isoform X2 n=1 Tax=Poeciliopsis prolifica TaxID=188132 RepID=UPI00241429CB|nr:hsp90 co-chaperone Cdc37 isoform X2 [Poeciliopsis prolifica]